MKRSVFRPRTKAVSACEAVSHGNSNIIVPYRLTIYNLITFFATLLLATLFFTDIVSATTYYVDYQNGSDSNDATSKNTPWKHCPGMKGFSGSYTHTSGDVFIFKGGVTWPSSTMPLQISYSGAEGQIDTYTSDETWHTGTDYTKPTFDGEGILTGASPMVYVANRNYIRISGLRFVNGGVAGGKEGGRVVSILNSGQLEIDNCRFQPFSHHVIVGTYTTGNYKRLIIRDSEFSDSSNFIEFGLTDGNLDGLDISGNTIRDPYSMVVNYDHVDGIHCFRVSGSGLYTNLVIHHNLFTGNWGGKDGTSAATAMIFLEHGAQISPIVYNNVLSYKIENTAWKGAPFRTLMLFHSTVNPRVFNNTIVGRNIPDDMSSAIDFFSTSNVECQNNIIKGIKNCIRLDSATVSKIDKNLLFPPPGTFVGIVNAYFCSWPTWQGTYNYDLNGSNADPLFVTATYPYDLTLHASSPAIRKAENLKTYFTTDFRGYQRNLDGPWNVGAYEGLGRPSGIRTLNLTN